MIASVLSTLGYPVVHPPYKGNAREYITYQSMGQIGGIYAEGETAETGAAFAVDFYTDTYPIGQKIKTIKATLEAAGYITTIEAEQYEDDTKLRHISMAAVTDAEEYD